LSRKPSIYGIKAGREGFRFFPWRRKTRKSSRKFFPIWALSPDKKGVHCFGKQTQNALNGKKPSSPPGCGAPGLFTEEAGTTGHFDYIEFMANTRRFLKTTWKTSPGHPSFTIWEA
jgi:hypothetical protein